MMDPEAIDELINEARVRDNTVCQKLLAECSRMVCVDQHQGYTRNFSLDTITMALRPARYSESGNSAINMPTQPAPETCSYAYQLYSAIMFAVDARAELKLLELIASPNFYSAIMRSASEQPD